MLRKNQMSTFSRLSTKTEDQIFYNDYNGRIIENLINFYLNNLVSFCSDNIYFVFKIPWFLK